MTSKLQIIQSIPPLPQASWQAAFEACCRAVHHLINRGYVQEANFRLMKASQYMERANENNS